MRNAVIMCPTDTIYGFSARVVDTDAVERVFVLKNRDKKLATIILISDIEQIEQFGAELTDSHRYMLEKLWPGPVSIIMPVDQEKWGHMTAPDGTLAFRMPNVDELREFIRRTGPLISTSVNKSGEPPMTTVAEAQQYFGDKVDFYVDQGERKGAWSSIIRVIR